jgi:predicted ATPase/DNA-binding XRE family transcriptional regulator
MEPVVSFGGWVRRRRRQLDLTQAQLAQQIGVATITIQKIEADERRPSLQVAELLASQLQLPALERQRFLKSARAELAGDQLTPLPLLPLPDTHHAPTRSLPNPLTGLIGRAAELATLTSWIAQGKRLITLTGVGGSGKTRLALQLGHAAAAMFPDGAWFIDLAPVGHPDGVISAIAAALQIPENPERSLTDGIVAWVQNRRALLILDNYEHVIETAPLVFALVQAAAGLNLLITSRLPLRIVGECEYAVQPLTLPAAKEHGDPIDVIAHAGAVQLFVERAQAITTGFRVTATNASDIAAICSALDGLPLAIELAAARIRVFPPAQLLEQLMNSRFAILHGSAANMPARQRTMQATLDWSYRFLLADEQHLLNQIAVFVGGCDLEALTAICGFEPTMLLNMLETLIAHSLIKVDEQPVSGRYGMLETIRAYALEQLQQRQLEQPIRERHAAYFMYFAEQAEHELRGRNEVHWQHRVDAEHANLQAALAWCLERPNAADEQRLMGWRIVAALWQFWHSRGHFQVWCRWMRDQLAAAAIVPTELQGRLALSAAQWAMIDNDDTMQTLLAQAYELLAANKQSWWYTYTLGGVCWNSYEWDRDNDRARILIHELIARAEQSGDPWLRAESYIRCGDTLNELSKAGEGLPELEHGLALARLVGNPSQITEALLVLGRHAIYLGEPTRAQLYLSECLAITQNLGTWYQSAVVLAKLGSVAHQTGNLAMGRRIQQERLTIAQRLGNQNGIVAVYRDLARIEMIAGNLTLARSYLEQSLAHAPQPIHSSTRDLTLLVEADLCFAEGNLVAARQLAQQLLTIDDNDFVARGYEILSRIALLSGDIPEARRNLMLSVQHNSFVRQKVTICKQLELVGALLAAENQPVDAARIWGSAECLREQHGISIWPIDQSFYAERVAAARTQASTDEWDSAWEAGRGLSLEQARNTMRQSLDR